MAPTKKASKVVADRESSKSARSTPIDESELGATSDDSMNSDENYVPSETQSAGNVEVEEEEADVDEEVGTEEDDEDAEVDQLLESDEEGDSQTKTTSGSTEKGTTSQARTTKQALVLKGDERVSKLVVFRLMHAR